MRYITNITTDDTKITHIQSSVITNGELVEPEVWTIELTVKYLEASGCLKTYQIDENGNVCFADVEKYGDDAIRSVKDGEECNNLRDLPEI